MLPAFLRWEAGKDVRRCVLGQLSTQIRGASPTKNARSPTISGRAFCIGAGFEPARPRKAFLLIREVVSATHPPSQIHGGIGYMVCPIHISTGSRGRRVVPLRHRECPMCCTRNLRTEPTNWAYRFYGSQQHGIWRGLPYDLDCHENGCLI